MSSYNDLDIYKMAYKYAIEVHHMSLTLPNYELYEQGSQVRRSSKSIKDTIAEGYGRKRYTADYIKFLTYALASNDETIDHLETLFETESLKDIEFYNNVHEKLNLLGKKINLFRQAIEKSLNK